MSIFNDDRASFNQTASNFDEDLSNCGLDSVLQNAYDAGMNLDEIMYVLLSHTERTVRRYVVQYQLKRAAKKDR